MKNRIAGETANVQERIKQKQREITEVLKDFKEVPPDSRLDRGMEWVDARIAEGVSLLHELLDLQKATGADIDERGQRIALETMFWSMRQLELRSSEMRQDECPDFEEAERSFLAWHTLAQTYMASIARAMFVVPAVSKLGLIDAQGVWVTVVAGVMEAARVIEINSPRHATEAKALRVQLLKTCERYDYTDVVAERGEVARSLINEFRKARGDR